jgi:hypothetical protein
MTYSWIVLNNYGNHPAYTSYRVFGLPRTFTVLGDTLQQPINIWPRGDTTLTSRTDSVITLTWTNLDPRANTYQVYLYVASDIEQIGAQLVVWEDEVSAGQFEGDTASVTFNAKSILTANRYTWKAIAVDDRGAGRAGEVTGFRYEAPTGRLKVLTKEKIRTGDTSLVVSVAAVELELEVLDGSLEAPLLYFTDTSGTLKRDRPRGTYRVTAVKNGFQPQTHTLTVDSGQTTLDTFFLERPDATVFGKVLDSLGDPVGLATVTGVSERDDTVKTQTDALGNYVLSCYEADWTIRASKKGYTDALARDTTVHYAQNVQMDPFTIKLNPNVLSGIVKNENGTSLIGAQVRLFREGVLVDEVPSTPQTGAFSFHVESGVYRLTADRTGFTSYGKSIEVLGSEHVQIAMTSRAAVVKGAVYGRTWSRNRFVYAPITNAMVLFIEEGSPDTLQTVSDAVYGDFSISLPGGKTYAMHSSAAGYIGQRRSTPVTTEKGQTHIITDTLAGLGMLRGRVAATSDGHAVDKVTVNVLDETGAVAAFALSDLKGSFEIRGILDGSYTIRAGKEGAVTDTIRLRGAGGDTLCARLIVDQGRVFAPPSGADTLFVDSLLLLVREGNRYLSWSAEHDGESLTGVSIKLSSPLIKTLAPGDTLAGVGTGKYVLAADADTNVIVDLAHHTFTVDTATGIAAVDTAMDSIGRIDTVRYYHTETLAMPVTHSPLDSISLTDGRATLELVVKDTTLNEGRLYYRDAANPTFDSVSFHDDSVDHDGGVYTYPFEVSPRKNGSTMLYYFRARIGDDWYGYAKETYTTYVRPDTTRLSKIAVVPSSDDTLVLPAETEVVFRLKGYYGSKFLPAEGLSGTDVTWTARAGGKAAPSKLLSDHGGLEVSIDAAQAKEGVVYTLRAKIDTVRQPMVAGASSSAAVTFRVTDDRLDSIRVLRVGGDDGPITTSSIARARFIAEGISEGGELVAITPEWSLYPEQAGTVSEEGVFRPAAGFVGWVEIRADVGDVRGEFNRRQGQEINRSGLQVNHLVGSEADTAANGRGCTVVFPDSTIPAGLSAALSVDMPVLTNRVALNTGDYTVISSPFDVELWNVNTGGTVTFKKGRAASLILAIPEDYHDLVDGRSGDFKIGRWDSDSVQWVLLDSSGVDPASKEIRVELAGFSRYAILYKMQELKGVWSISPNPFSPRIRPVHEYGRNAPAGTCIRVRPVSQHTPVRVRIDIYNLTSDRVWSVTEQSARRGEELRLWWDGTSLRETYTIGGNRELETDAGIQIRGDRMCRNGRYFAVLTVSSNEEEKQYMKPIILFK